MTGPFNIPEGMPRIEHAVVDEQTQMQRYLAEIGMEDIALLPDPSMRRIRPKGLMTKYRRTVAAELAAEAAMSDAELDNKYRSDNPAREWMPPIETITMYWAESGEPVEVAVSYPQDAAEFKGE